MSEPGNDETTETISEKENAVPTRSNNRIVFASCNSQLYDQPLWDPIMSRDPAAFIWGGDAIYADDKEGGEADPEKLRGLYDGQKQDPGYAKLLSTKIPISGVLDDHDYGQDNVSTAQLSICLGNDIYVILFPLKNIE